MLRYRLIFGPLMIAAFLGIVAFDAWYSQQAINVQGEDPAIPALQAALPLTGLLIVLMLVSVYELGRLCNVGGYRPVAHWAAFVCVGLVCLPWIEMQRSLSSGVVSLEGLAVNADRYGSIGQFGMEVLTIVVTLAQVNPVLVWLTGGFLGACLLVLARRQTERAVAHIATTLFIILYLGVLGSFIVRIRCLWPSADGAWLLLVFVLTVKSGDIGAFFTGKLCGRHKLISWLSPGKTIEGAVGALVFSAVVAVAAMQIWAAVEGHGWAPLSITQAIIFGVFMAVFGHIGDLLASLIKRDVGSKDSGAVLPAFGGFLDIFDSPLLAAPVAWVLLTTWAPMM
jgi:CDP-diglyceride synthetase